MSFGPGSSSAVSESPSKRTACVTLRRGRAGVLGKTPASPDTNVLVRTTSPRCRRPSPRQRRVLLAVVLDDVLAERLGTTRGALYKTIHDARARLRAALKECDLDA
jgi:hypothetical protein